MVKMKRLLLGLLLLASFISLPSPQAHATINSLINKNIYSGDGTTVAWPYTFPILQSSDIQIYTIDNLGNQVQVTTNYSINTGTDIVTYPVSGSPIASGWQIILLRVEPLNQQLSLSNQGNLPAKSLEAAYDKLTMEVQQINEVQSRSIVQSLDSNATVNFPLAIPGDLLGWDLNSNLVNVSNPSLVGQWTLTGANLAYNLGNVSTTQTMSANLFNGNINWADVQNLLTHANVNWNDFNMQALLNGGGINWNDVNRLGKINRGGLNWSDFHNGQLPGAGINWNDIVQLASPSNFFKSGIIPIANLATGTPTGSKFIRDDGTLQIPVSGIMGTTINSSYSVNNVYGPMTTDTFVWGTAEAHSSNNSSVCGGELNVGHTSGVSDATYGICESQSSTTETECGYSGLIPKGWYFEVYDWGCGQAGAPASLTVGS